MLMMKILFNLIRRSKGDSVSMCEVKMSTLVNLPTKGSRSPIIQLRCLYIFEVSKFVKCNMN
jgi:hypothetical protein